MQVRFTDSARKELKKIGPARSLIISKIKQYAADPASVANNVKALKGREEFRLRVGNHRVLFVIEENGSITIMLVTAVKHRRDAYG